MKPTSLRPKSQQSMTLDQINDRMKVLTTKKGIYTKTLAYIGKIKVDIEGPLWEHIRQKCNDLIASVDALEDKSDEYSPTDHPIMDRVLWKAAGLRKGARTILGVEAMIKNEEGYRDGLIKMDKEIKELGERKQQLGAGTK